MKDKKMEDKIWKVVVILLAFSLGVAWGWLTNEYLGSGVAKMVALPFVLLGGAFMGMVVVAMIMVVLKSKREW